jgi:hypothetical protein
MGVNNQTQNRLPIRTGKGDIVPVEYHPNRGIDPFERILSRVRSEFGGSAFAGDKKSFLRNETVLPEQRVVYQLLEATRCTKSPIGSTLFA